MHHPHPPGVQDRAEALHHPSAGAEVPGQAGGGLPSHRQAEVPHSPGQGGQAGKLFFIFLIIFYLVRKMNHQMRKLNHKRFCLNAFDVTRLLMWGFVQY